MIIIYFHLKHGILIKKYIYNFLYSEKIIYMIY